MTEQAIPSNTFECKQCHEILITDGQKPADEICDYCARKNQEGR